MSLSGQDFSMFSGETKDLVCTVRDPGGAPFDISGSSIRWELQPDLLTNGGAAIIKTSGPGGGITFTDALAGIFTIRLDTSDTTGLYHEARITDASGNVVTVFTGMATIQKTAIG